MDHPSMWVHFYLKSDSSASIYDEEWTDVPTFEGKIINSIVVPFICFLGMCGNTICFLVLIRKEMKASVFTYLCVLAIVDFLKCFGLFLYGIWKGMLWYVKIFDTIDPIVAVPAAGAICCMSTIATVAVSLDRVIYLWNPAVGRRPKLCRQTVARKIMLTAAILSVISNIPYCFIFQLAEDGDLVVTDFFYSRYYSCYNWITFFLFGIVPATILIVANTMLIIAVKRAWATKAKCRRNMGKSKCSRTSWDQVYLTMTLIAVVFFFLIGEIPLYLISRKSAITFIYPSRESNEFEDADLINTLRDASTIISSIHSSINFVVYCGFCPQFIRSLKKLFRHDSEDVENKKCGHKKLKVIKIFVVGTQVANKWVTGILSNSSVEPTVKIHSELEVDSNNSEDDSSDSTRVFDCPLQTFGA